MNVVHAGPDGDDPRIDVRLVVAQSSGLFEPAPPSVVTVEGEVVFVGAVIGHVVGAGRRVPVVSFCTGFLIRVMVQPGERVRPGQPLVWLHPVDRPATHPDHAA
ncbi:MAG: hypothetical protein ABI239_10855 [Aquihabitans sp.]